MKSNSIVTALVELKRPYQRNALVGFGISAGLNVAIAGSMLLFCSNSVEPTKINTGGDPITISVHTIPPPRIAEKQHQPAGNQSAKPNIGVPKPVPDSQAFVDATVPTQTQLTDIDLVTPVESLGVGVAINPDSLESILPGLDTFIAHETEPVPVDLVQPVYPDLAMRAGVEGKVWLRVLIDRDGKVRQVRVEKSTNQNAGFEEAAIAAAWQSVWRPAIANGLPISVPVTYSVEFKLKQ